MWADKRNQCPPIVGLKRKHSQTGTQVDVPSTIYPSTSTTSSQHIQHSSELPSQTPCEKTVTKGIYVPYKNTHHSHMPVPLVRDEAMLFNHFTRHLGRWLDCTNAARIFTLTISEKIHESPILFNAVLCFAARHRRDTIAGDRHYERCISLLIERLGSTQAYDELLLSAVLLLHFADQLGGDDDRANTQSRDKHHLKGTSSILRASLKEGFVDPSASSLRDAAFWIYVRQSLYNATISQEPLDLDLTLTLHPTPDHMTDSHPLAWLRIETAWANQVLWITARVANFCFSGSKVPATWRDVGRLQQWHDLWDANEKWRRERPSGFDAIGEGECADDHVFPDVWFTADWHVISYVFYHFSAILLLRYKPDSKFLVRWVSNSSLTLTDRKILNHARAILSAVKSSLQNAQLLIILCHTVFIWGPLISETKEREEVIRLLGIFEETHNWRTGWIVKALREEWGMD